MTMDFLFHFVEVGEEVTVEQFRDEIPEGHRKMIDGLLVYKGKEVANGRYWFLYFDNLGGAQVYNFD